MTVKEHLEAVLVKVQETYWSRGSLRAYTYGGNHEYEYCALGLLELTGEDRNYHSPIAIERKYPEETRILALTSGRSSGGYVFRIVDKNDGAKNRESIVNWLKRAIAKAEREEQ